MSFAELLGGMSLEVFQREYWERRPHLLSGQGLDSSAELFTRRDFEDVLFSARPPIGEIGFAGAGDSADAQRRLAILIARISRSGLGGYPLRAIADLFASGVTISLNNVQEKNRRVARFCSNLERELHCNISATAYLTRQNQQGLPPHFDTFNIFVLQLEGTKRWRISTPGHRFPYFGAGTRPTATEQDASEVEPVLDVELGAGDVLYLPRGFIHEALSGPDTHSLHLSIGLHSLAWIDFFYLGLRLLGERDPKWRQSIPLGPPASWPKGDSIWASAMQEAAERVGLDDVKQAYEINFATGGKVDPVGLFSTLDKVHDVHDESIVRRRDGARVAVYASGTELTIVASGRKETLPSDSGDALGALLALDGEGVALNKLADSSTFEFSELKRVTEVLARAGVIVLG